MKRFADPFALITTTGTTPFEPYEAMIGLEVDGAVTVVLPDTVPIS